MSSNVPLLKGTLDLLLLQALSGGPTHGYGLAVWIEEGSGGNITVEDSAIYQALRRMERKQLVAAEWGLTENNRRARYYSLTRQGEAHLRQERAVWFNYTEWVSGLLKQEAVAE